LTPSSTYTVRFDPFRRETVIIDPVDEQIERDLEVLRQLPRSKLIWAGDHAHARPHHAVPASWPNWRALKPPPQLAAASPPPRCELKALQRAGHGTIAASHARPPAPAAWDFIDHVFTGDAADQRLRAGWASIRRF
jgi:hypothetical protein